MKEPATYVGYDLIDEIPLKLQEINEYNSKKKFIFVYSVYPDTLEHKYGVNSEKVQKTLLEIDSVVCDIYKKMKRILI